MHIHSLLPSIFSYFSFFYVFLMVKVCWRAGILVVYHYPMHESWPKNDSCSLLLFYSKCPFILCEDLQQLLNCVNFLLFSSVNIWIGDRLVFLVIEKYIVFGFRHQILRQHIKAVHQKLQPFACQFSGCGKKFPYRHVRDNHQNSGVHVFVQVNICLYTLFV